MSNKPNPHSEGGKGGVSEVAYQGFILKERVGPVGCSQNLSLHQMKTWKKKK
jgi:hypothetical protein